MARVHRWLGTGLAGLAAGLAGPLAAQSLWLPASDPVGIARSGTGVAFGQSLEASSLNPALLVTLRDASSAFLGLGMEMASAQTTLQSNQRSLFTADRDRVLPSLGAAWRFDDRLSFGVKLDEPFLRHAEVSPESTIRFLGRSIDLKTNRLEFQTAWAFRPDISFGAGLGLARISYASSVNLRSQVLQDPSQAPGAANSSIALVEVGARQSGSATVPSYSLGFRWAISPRWTLAGAHQSSLRGNLSLQAEPASDAPTFYDNNGFGLPPVSSPTDPVGLARSGTLARLQYEPGTRRIALPSKTTLGLRHRMNQFFTWEFDLHHIESSGFQVPSMPTLGTPSGTVGTQMPGAYRSGFGASIMGEMSLGRAWTFRAGARLDPALQDDATINPLISGSRSASFSAGAGYRIWGGELNAGYQFRQNRDLDSNLLEGAWDVAGYRTVGTKTRVEGMGHLWSIGFKRSF
jgi:long-subunit fatty acid transport protein